MWKILKYPWLRAWQLSNFLIFWSSKLKYVEYTKIPMTVQLPLLWLCHVFFRWTVFIFWVCHVASFVDACIFALTSSELRATQRLSLSSSHHSSIFHSSLISPTSFRVRGSVANFIWGLVWFQRLSVQASPNRRLFRWKILLASQIRCESSLYLLLLISLFVHFLCFFVSFQDDS